MSAAPSDRREGIGQQSEQDRINVQKEALLKRILEQDARMRLANIRMVKPELAATVESYLVGLASQGRIASQITDAQLKQLLLSMQQPKREFKINRR